MPQPCTFPCCCCHVLRVGMAKARRQGPARIVSPKCAIANKNFDKWMHGCLIFAECGNHSSWLPVVANNVLARKSLKNYIPWILAPTRWVCLVVFVGLRSHLAIVPKTTRFLLVLWFPTRSQTERSTCPTLYHDYQVVPRGTTWPDLVLLGPPCLSFLTIHPGFTQLYGTESPFLQNLTGLQRLDDPERLGAVVDIIPGTYGQNTWKLGAHYGRVPKIGVPQNGSKWLV